MTSSQCKNGIVQFNFLNFSAIHAENLHIILRKKTKIKYLFMHVRLEDNQCERNLVKNSVKRKSKSVNVSYMGFFFVIFFSSEGGGGGVN